MKEKQQTSEKMVSHWLNFMLVLINPQTNCVRSTETSPWEMMTSSNSCCIHHISPPAIFFYFLTQRLAGQTIIQLEIGDHCVNKLLFPGRWKTYFLDGLEKLEKGWNKSFKLKEDICSDIKRDRRKIIFFCFMSTSWPFVTTKKRIKQQFSTNAWAWYIGKGKLSW